MSDGVGDNVKDLFTGLFESFAKIPAQHRLVGFTLLIAAVALAIFGTNIWVLIVFLIFLAYVIYAVHQSADSLVDPGHADTSFQYAVFISTPMDSFADKAEMAKHIASVNSVKDALREAGGWKTPFYAGTDRPKEDKFDLPHNALPYNIAALKLSERFLLILPESSSSSCLVEVGAAIAMRKPTVIFLKNDVTLPFLLRGAQNASQKEGLPFINIFPYSDVGDIKSTIQQHKLELFK